MKLVYIANIRLPTEKAHGIQIMKMCEAFARHGLEVELLIPYRRNNLKDDPFEFYKVESNFKITRLYCLDLVSLDFIRVGFLLSSFTFLTMAKFYLLRHPYDILYTRELLSGLFFKNSFFELHALPEKIGRIYRSLLHKFKKFIVLTDITKNELVRLGFDKDKISAMPDAVDIKEFDMPISKGDARIKLGLPAGKKIILYTGSFLLYKWKGGDLLPAAADFLGDEYLFLLVGGHPWEIEKLKKSLKLKNTLLLPYVRHELIPFYLKAADVLVLPNRSGSPASEMYTSPLKLFEYMASGRPIISSDLKSLKEVLSEEVAIFFRPGDPADLARAISILSADDGLQKRLGENAFAKVHKYTWDERADKIIKWISS